MKKIMFNSKFGLEQAVLERKKTQTRRIITFPQTFKGRYVAGFHIYKRQSDGLISEVCMYDEDERDFDEGQIVPEYKVGEIVAVAQKYADCGGLMEDGTPRWNFIARIAGEKNGGWSNKMFIKHELMPHQIIITNVRIERLQDISNEDCLAEGITKWDAGQKDVPFYSYKNAKKNDFDTPREAYAALIDKVNGKGTWNSNPYVFVYDFELVK